MPVLKVTLMSDVYLACMNHVMSTEKEEVMGLLLGEISEDQTMLSVTSSKMLRRSDKAKDRVEISPEQLTQAAEHAEHLTNEVGRQITVLGWYHSHPHITVLPSHVDVRTQAAYQMMSDTFIGVIFSLFDDNKDSMRSQMKVICFQAKHGESLEIPIVIKSRPAASLECLKNLNRLPEILREEEEEFYGNAKIEFDLCNNLSNAALHTQALAEITQVIEEPLISTLTMQVAAAREKLQQRQIMLQALEEKIALKKYKEETSRPPSRGRGMRRSK